MNSVGTTQLVNQLISIHARSLPAYLSDAAPFVTAKHAYAKDVVEMIAADQSMTVDKLADYLIERNQPVKTGTFPIEFTGYHDLSIEFLLDDMLVRQKSEIEMIEGIVDALKSDPMIRPLAEEALGAAKGHLESIEEIRRGVS